MSRRPRRPGHPFQPVGPTGNRRFWVSRRPHKVDPHEKSLDGVLRWVTKLTHCRCDSVWVSVGIRWFWTLGEPGLCVGNPGFDSRTNSIHRSASCGSSTPPQRYGKSRRLACLVCLHRVQRALGGSSAGGVLETMSGLPELRPHCTRGGVHFVLRCGTPRSGLRTCLSATRCVLLCGPTLLRTCLWATWGAAGHGGTVGSACAAADASTIKARPLHSCCVVGGEAPHISEGFPRALVMQSQGFDPGSLLCKTLGSTRELRG